MGNPSQMHNLSKYHKCMVFFQMHLQNQSHSLHWVQSGISLFTYGLAVIDLICLATGAKFVQNWPAKSITQNTEIKQKTFISKLHLGI